MEQKAIQQADNAQQTALENPAFRELQLQLMVDAMILEANPADADEVRVSQTSQ